MKVLIYVNTNAEVGDVDHLKVCVPRTSHGDFRVKGIQKGASSNALNCARAKRCSTQNRTKQGFWAKP